MVTGIRVYVEGGGNNHASRRRMRSGFSGFLLSLRELAREKKLEWHVIPCGPRAEAFENFKLAVKTHPSAFVVLVIDSEEPVSGPVWDHVSRYDRWSRPKGILDSQCHLMAQAVEAWILADPDSLVRFYGQGFVESGLPRAQDIETVGKKRLLAALEQATRGTTKGTYHKIDHCAALLEKIDPSKVRTRAKHCDRLFRELEVVIRSS
jgi:hypothetical protein